MGKNVFNQNTDEGWKGNDINKNIGKKVDLIGITADEKKKLHEEWK